MKSIDTNISKHKNGMLYFVARRNRKLHVISLKTMDLEEARQKIRKIGITGLINTKKNAFPVPGVVTNPTLPANQLVPKRTLAEALAEHADELALHSEGTKKMAARARAVIAHFAKDWEDFNPVRVWKEYRATGIARQGKELGSAANHLRWFMGQFVPWAIERGYLGVRAMNKLALIPQIEGNSKRIREPAPELVGKFLDKISSEDPDGGAYLRFLASTGLKRNSAINLRWKDVDLNAGTMLVRKLRGREIVKIPMTNEAVSILLQRQGKRKPWPLDINHIERLERRMKRHAKEFNIDLTTFLAYRHYFIIRCLISGLTVQEVATLLGHSDNGDHVLKTYGHICDTQLPQALAKLKLTS